MEYRIWDEGDEKTVECDTIQDAEEEARDWLKDGEWDTESGTTWVSANIESEDGAETSSVTVAINPDEPSCINDAGHDWQAPYAIVGGCKENPGVWGHGGGVVIQAVCLRCGCGRLTDTWAQDPNTGEQGLESVEYQVGKYTVPVSDDE